MVESIQLNNYRNYYMLVGNPYELITVESLYQCNLMHSQIQQLGIWTVHTRTSYIGSMDQNSESMNAFILSLN